MATGNCQGGVAVLEGSQVAEIRQRAEAKRSEVGFGVFAPMGSKVLDCLNQMGILTLRFPIGDLDLGAFIGRRNGQDVVFINTALPRGKQHFAAAHELYHAWFDADALSTWSTVCEIGDNGGSSLREKQANRFAAEFLVPRSGMDRFIHSLPSCFEVLDHVVLLSDYFEVPSKTIILRLEEEQYISSKDKETLLSDPAVFMKRRDELGLDNSIEEPTHDRNVSPSFRAVMRENIRHGRVSAAKIAELNELLDSMPYVSE